jgi:multidrug resistance protein, MATE family
MTTPNDTVPGRPTQRAVQTVHHGREISRLAWPTVLAMLSQTLMWTVDTALLGRVSSTALAAAGLGGMITWAGYSLCNQLSRVTGTFVAQAHGRGDDEAVGDYTWQGIWLALAGGALLQAIGYFSWLLLPLTHNPPEVQRLAYTYIKWRSASAIGTQLTFALMGFFQGRRQVRIPMWAGIAANVLNAALAIWLIFGWSGVALGGRRWLAMAPQGVRGAAIATAVSVTFNALILVAWLLGPREHRRRFRIHVPRPPRLRELRDLVRVGLPSAGENFIDMWSFVIFSALIGQAGAVQLAASQITINVLSFSFMPLWGLTVAGSVLVGNHIGAGEPDQANGRARQVYKLGFYYTLVMAALMVTLRTHLFRVFSPDPAVLALGAGLAVAAAAFQIGDGLRMIGNGLLAGAGDTRWPMLQSLIVLWGLFLPLSWWIIVHQGWDVRAAWVGGGVIYTLQALGLWARFRSGRWRRVRIFSAESSRRPA